MIDKCLSTPEFIDGGKLKIKEEWQWLCVDSSIGYLETKAG